MSVKVAGRGRKSGGQVGGVVQEPAGAKEEDWECGVVEEFEGYYEVECLRGRSEKVIERCSWSDSRNEWYCMVYECYTRSGKLVWYCRKYECYRKDEGQICYELKRTP